MKHLLQLTVFNICSYSLIVYLLYAKDLAFCYALLSNDKIRQSYDNIQEISEQCESKISIVFSISSLYKRSFSMDFHFLNRGKRVIP